MLSGRIELIPFMFLGKLGGGCLELSLFAPFGWIKFQTKQGACFVCQDKTV